MFVHLGQKSNSKINPSEQINGIERTLATNYILNFCNEHHRKQNSNLPLVHI